MIRFLLFCFSVPRRQLSLSLCLSLCPPPPPPLLSLLPSSLSSLFFFFFFLSLSLSLSLSLFSPSLSSLCMCACLSPYVLMFLSAVILTSHGIGSLSPTMFVGVFLGLVSYLRLRFSFCCSPFLVGRLHWMED